MLYGNVDAENSPLEILITRVLNHRLILNLLSQFGNHALVLHIASVPRTILKAGRLIQMEFQPH